MNGAANHGHKSVMMVALGLAFASLAISGLAHAACPVPQSVITASAPTKFTNAVYTASDPLSRSRIGNVDPNVPAAIVGLWKFEMISQSMFGNVNPMPDGTLIDFGTSAWHSDGTELMNSGMRDPTTGDFCQGVWSQVGPSTFALNHIGLSWANGSYLGPAIIEELVEVSPSGNHLKGFFRITQYEAAAVIGQEFDESTILVVITGTLTGRRFSVD